MGGVQSQEPCDSDSPKYNYHERVLQDAEAELSDYNMAPSAAVNGDDQYFSAGEGDSICSLTPERTRPESSSAENFSDTSDNHGSMDEDTSLAEAHESSVFENKSPVSVNSFANEASHKNCHCNDQGGKHVRTYMNQPCARHQNGLVNLEDKGSCSEGAGCRNKDITSCEENFTHSTGMPNPNLQEQRLVKTCSESHKHVANCGASSECEKTFLLPGYTVSAISNCKRKRCKYLESSESDSDGGNKERYKKKMKSRHRRKSRRIRRSIRSRGESHSDSDESDCEKRNQSLRSMCIGNSNSEGSASERDCRCMNQKFKKQLCYTGVNGHVCDKNVDSKQLTACCHNVDILQRHTVESSVANGGDTIESRQDGRYVHSCSHCRVPEQNLENTIYNDKLAIFQNSDLMTTTLPNRQDSWSNQCQSSVSMKNAPSFQEQFPQAESVAGSMRSSPSSQRFHAGVDTFGTGPSSDNESQTAPETDTGGFISVQESADLSTLANVPNPKSMGSGLSQQAESFKTAKSRSVVEPTLKTGTNSTFCQSRKPDSENKHKEETVADKIMHLFSAAKKDIESNIKSLLSVVTFTDTIPNSSKPYWQTYLSETSSASKACLNSRSVQQTHMKASIKHQCMDGQEAQVDSPLVSQGLLHKVHPAIDITIQVSPSCSHSGELSATSSLAAQRNCNYVDSTPSAVATHNDSFKDSKQRLVSKGSGAVSVQITSNNSPSKYERSSTQTDTSSVEWLPLASVHQVLNCCLAGAICLSVSVGELGEQKTSGIVNWTDGALTHSLTRCSRSVASKAGALMWASCADYIKNKGSELEAPDVLTTPAGGRFDKSVVALLHVVEPRLVGENDNSNASSLVEVYANCLRFANERLGLDSISFPLIGDSTFPFDICVQSFFDAILVFLAEQTPPENFDLTSVQLTIPDLNTASFAADLISSHLQGVSNQDLYSVARDTYNHYFGKQITRHKAK